MFKQRVNKQMSLERQEEVAAWTFIAPFVIGFAIFTVIPILYTIFLSFTHSNTLNSFSKGLLRGQEFYGLQNFLAVFKDTITMNSFLRGFEFAAIYVIALISVPLILAVLLNNDFYMKKFTRTVILLPYVTNTVAIAIAFGLLFSPFGGPVNTILNMLGVKNLPLWYQGTATALPMAALTEAWHNQAFQIIVFLAALQDVPKELYESAQMDGASPWVKFRYITLPLISPTTFFLVISSFVGSFNNYAAIKLYTDGGPGTASRTITYNIYETTFTFNHYSNAAAQSVILFIVILLVTIIQWKGQKKWVHYQI
jgi:multiple sugar transport system permease protein